MRVAAAVIALEIGTTSVRLTDSEIRCLTDLLVAVHARQGRADQRPMNRAVLDRCNCLRCVTFGLTYLVVRLVVS